MHNIYHTLYWNPLLEHFLGWSGLIRLRSVQFQSLWWYKWSQPQLSTLSLRYLVLIVDNFLKIIFYAVILPVAGVYNYSCHRVWLFYSYFPKLFTLRSVKLTLHYTNVHTHMHHQQHPSTPTWRTHSASPPLLPCPKRRQNKGEERESGRAKMGKGTLWSGFPSQWVCRPSPQDVSPFAERE